MNTLTEERLEREFKVTEKALKELKIIVGKNDKNYEMKGKLTVMTIITGVRSPWILGKMDEKTRVREEAAFSSELGIDFAH